MSFDTHDVLTGVSCAFESGTITGLIGDNGAGKTTLMRIAATVLEPTRGEIRMDGRTLAHEDIHHRSVIGALIEHPGHYNELSVRENLSFFYAFHCRDREACQFAVARGIQRFELNTVADETVGGLSTGYRQRVAVARAFHPGARIILLDEPLAGLDPTTRSHLKDTMRCSAREGVAICLSSHGLGDLDALCDALYVLADGTLHRFTNFDQMRDRVRAAPDTDLDLVYSQLIAALRERHS